MIVRDIVKMKGGTVYSVEPRGTVSDAVSTMVKRDIGSLVVLDGAKLAGMLTFREVLTALEAHRGSLAGLEVRDIMLRNPSAAAPRTRWKACANS